MDTSSLGDRIKLYEASTDARILPRLPIVVRLDGRSFSKFTKGMDRPFDANFRQAMIDATKALVKETNAIIGYTQSDEITLVYHVANIKGQAMFDGRVQKMCSIFSSIASTHFLMKTMEFWPDKIKNGKYPQFDCRVFATPNRMEAVNAILWREQDATKNSIQQVARAYFSHNQCRNKNGKELQQMLLVEKDINWNDFSDSEKRGTYVRRVQVKKPLSEEKLAKIPENHRPGNNEVIRHEIQSFNLPILTRIENIIEVIFEGAQPILKSE